MKIGGRKVARDEEGRKSVGDPSMFCYSNCTLICICVAFYFGLLASNTNRNITRSKTRIGLNW